MTMTHEECGRVAQECHEKYYKKNLIYALNFDELPSILKKGKIEKERFVGFTRGFPAKLGHGNVIVIFKRSKLRKKYKLIDVEYTKEFMNKHPSLKIHVLQGLTENEMNQICIREVENYIQFYKNQPQTAKTKSIISSYKMTINTMKKYPFESCMRGLKNEKETLIKRDVIEFSIDDIFSIIYPSRSFLEYYPVKEVFHEKMIFVDDHFPPEFADNSPLAVWYDFACHETNNNKEGAIAFVSDLSFLYLYVYGISMGMKDFRLNASKEINSVPDDVDYLLKNIHKIKNRDSKFILVDFLSSVQICHSWKGLEKEYKPIISRAIEELKTKEQSE